MNFFERQVAARRNSRLLMILFVAAVVGIVAALDLAATGIWYFTRMYVDRPLESVPRWLHAAVIGGAVATILFTSLAKTLEVYRGGGLAVARMMGARQVVPLRASPLERRLLNIVQEMAIASGTRVPIVYVLDEHGGINAFAAGFDGKLCAIVVTRGALERLNRDELQGVMGHEFSHIVNGDMAFNLQMIGVLAGLMFIGGAGDFILRSTRGLERSDVRVGAVVLFVGMSLLVIGYVGLFAGQVIKALIAREREYLADAGSVQFTRNPDGLAGALDQVRRSHSTVLHLHTEDVSHLFFAEAVYLEEERLLSTHPPLDDRVKRLAPAFRPDRYRDLRPDPLADMQRDMGKVAPQPTGEQRLPITPAQALGLVGTFEDRDVRTATALVNALPAPATAALQTRDGTGALAIALILSAQDAVLEEELAALRAAGFEALASAASALLPVTRALPMAWHLPVADLALAELLRQPAAYRSDVARALEAVIDADREVSVYRYACLNLMRSQLAPGARKVGRQSIAALHHEVVLLLSLLAYAGSAGQGNFLRAFEAGVKEMELQASAPAPRERCDAQALTEALERLSELAPLAKARLIRGFFAAVATDGRIRIVEAALMRMMGAVLDCPLPPLIDELDPGQLAA